MEFRRTAPAKVLADAFLWQSTHAQGLVIKAECYKHGNLFNLNLKSEPRHFGKIEFKLQSTESVEGKWFEFNFSEIVVWSTPSLRTAEFSATPVCHLALQIALSKKPRETGPPQSNPTNTSDEDEVPQSGKVNHNRLASHQILRNPG